MINTKIYKGIKEVPIKNWDSILTEKSLTFTYKFWEIIENSKLEGFSNFNYFIFYDEKEIPIGLAVSYILKSDMAIFSSPKFKYTLNLIRKVFPNFLKFNFLECGTPVTVNSPPLVILNDKYKQEILFALNKQLNKIAIRKRCLIIIFRDFEALPKIEVYRRIFKKMRYSWLISLPNTYMKVRWKSIDGYIASMKSYYRSKLLKHLNRNKLKKISHEIVDDFKHLSEVLCKQWIVIYNNASEMKREMLTPEFYNQFSEKLGAKSKVILYYSEKKLIGHALLLEDNDLLRWMYIGREKSISDSLYIYIIYSVIETAINLNMKELELGVTTYAIKRDVGAEIVNNNIAIRLIVPFCNLFVSPVYNIMNTPHCPKNKQIFKV